MEKGGKRQKMEIKVTEAWGEREVRMIDGKRMEHLEDDKREMVRGAKTGGEARRKEGKRRKCLKKREEEKWEKSTKVGRV